MKNLAYGVLLHLLDWVLCGILVSSDGKIESIRQAESIRLAN